MARGWQSAWPKSGHQDESCAPAVWQRWCFSGDTQEIFSFSGDIQDLFGQGAVQPALGDLALAGGLD